ncbi:MAG: DUF4190 domain-containing protein [Sedimentisphaerales bacterium]|nr:DUF4190 domain-containing protein [Sedimentisphaerales bacterium]
MYCPKCGLENEEGRELCSACNWVLSSQFSEPTKDARTSGLAITALVLGLLSLCTGMLTALPAIIFGIVALVKISKSRGQLKGNGMAIAGIGVPAVFGLFILPMMLAILMPALSKTRHLAERLVCATNLKGLGTAMVVYANDYDNKFPTGDKWNDLLVSETDVNPLIFRCKSADEGPSNYAMNENLAGKSTSVPAQTVLLFESGPGWNQVGGADDLSVENHCEEGCNILFADGHTEFVMSEDIDSLEWGDETTE